jgi:hypothetical protein
MTSLKLKIMIKNFLLYRKRTKKVHLNIFALANQNPPFIKRSQGEIFFAITKTTKIPIEFAETRIYTYSF